MSIKSIFPAALAVVLAACGSNGNIHALHDKLAEAETAVKLSAENTKRLENIYSDIYFDLNSLTAENFEAKVARGDTFYAYIGRPSCGDCNAFEPMFKGYIRQYQLNDKIYYVNVHKLNLNKPAWTAFKARYGLSGTPVLAKYGKGKQINKLDFEENQGISPEALEKWLKLNRLLSGSSI